MTPPQFKYLFIFFLFAAEENMRLLCCTKPFFAVAQCSIVKYFINEMLKLKNGYRWHYDQNKENFSFRKVAHLEFTLGIQIRKSKIDLNMEALSIDCRNKH